MRRPLVALVLACIAAGPAAAEDMRFAYLVVERLEYLEDPEAALIDADFIYAGDSARWLARLEATRPDSGGSDAELKLLYSRPASAFFDLQFGATIERHDGDETVGAGIGIEGEAPYFIHTRLFAGLDTDGDLAVEGEFERDFWLSRRLALQPRVQLATSNDGHSADLELRLRFEIHRKFLPYVGVARQHVSGDGGHADDTTLLVGAAFWF